MGDTRCAALPAQRGTPRIVGDSAGGSVSRQHAARALATAMLASVLFGFPGVTPTAQAADFDHRDRDRDCGRWSRPRSRPRLFRSRRRLAQRPAVRSGDRNRWERIHHDDYGDCFRTPWGLACETSRLGVFRVHDRHRGDEPAPTATSSTSTSGAGGVPICRTAEGGWVSRGPSRGAWLQPGASGLRRHAPGGASSGSRGATACAAALRDARALAARAAREAEQARLASPPSGDVVSG